MNFIKPSLDAISQRLYSFKHTLSSFSKGQKVSLGLLGLFALSLPVLTVMVFMPNKSRNSMAMDVVTPPSPPNPPSLLNGSFEIDKNADRLPDHWSTKNLGQNDLMEYGFAHTGKFSFNFAPATSSANLRGQLLQTLRHWGNANEAITLNIWNASSKVVLNGKVGVVLKVTYNDGFVDATSGTFPRDAHNWVQKTLVLVTDRPYQSIKVILFNTNRSTNYDLDDAQLQFTLNAAQKGLKTTPSALTPAELHQID